MKLFKPSKHDENLIKLLRRTGGDFKFDELGVKSRLLTSIEQTAIKPVKHFHLSRALQYSVTFTGLVIIISSTFAVASTARPADKLFGLNKFGEQVILGLPLPAEQKAKVQEYIVTTRLEALDEVVSETKVEAKLKTVKESDESLTKAVDTITEKKTKLEGMGKTEAANSLEKVLDNLQSKALQREATLKALEDETEDKDTKEQIRSHRQKIEVSRQKARAQIRRFQNQDSKDDQTKNPR